MRLRIDGLNELYAKYQKDQTIVFYIDAIEELMRRKKDMTYDRFCSFINYLFRTPALTNITQFTNCINIIMDNTWFKVIPNITTPYTFSKEDVRKSLGLYALPPLDILTQKLWKTIHIDNTGSLVMSYIYKNNMRGMPHLYTF